MICPRCRANMVPDGLQVCPACFIAGSDDAKRLICEVVDYLRKWSAYELWCADHEKAA